MLFLKRLILGFLALGFIFLGGSGTQSGSILAQGGGFVGLILGVIVLYIFFKMAWRAMGCLPSFIMFCIVIFFILYAIGALSNGVGNLGPSLKSFVGQSQDISQDLDVESTEEDIMDEDDLNPIIDESFPEMGEQVPEAQQQNSNNRQQPQQAQQPQQPKASGGLEGIINSIKGQSNSLAQEEPAAFDPTNFPAIYGTPKVINGDTIAINGGYLKIYGIDAPEANQSCADRQGRSYKCGRESAMWLRSWITGNNIECRIMKRDKRGNMMGICSLGEYDIGAALVNAGWAVADINSTDIYYPYQQQAKANKRGLWQGKFYMPWDWRVMQTKKPKIKVIKPKAASTNFLDL